MAIRVSGNGQASPAPDDGNGEEETDEQFEERVYAALMKVARLSSGRTRTALGTCVMLGTPYGSAAEEVREAIREFIDEAEL